MQDFSPYTDEERREMRRLLIASGFEIDAWCNRLRRSADFLLSLSAEQAGVVAEQAAAIASDPLDYGDEQELERTRTRIAQIDEQDKAKFVWNEIVAMRRRHYPAPSDC
jgi:hypothetical protein